MVFTHNFPPHNSTVWNNSVITINRKSVFIGNWFERDIIFVTDLMDCNGSILSLCGKIKISNPQSLQNKMDKLQAHVRFQHDFRAACLLAITETWLSERDLDSEVAVDGFD